MADERNKQFNRNDEYNTISTSLEFTSKEKAQAQIGLFFFLSLFPNLLFIKVTKLDRLHFKMILKNLGRSD